MDAVSVDFDMYLLAGQHPYLAVLMALPLPRLLNAFLSPVRVFHLLPHSVRLNPLSLNTIYKVRVQSKKTRRKEKIKKKMRNEYV